MGFRPMLSDSQSMEVKFSSDPKSYEKLLKSMKDFLKSKFQVPWILSFGNPPFLKVVPTMKCSKVRRFEAKTVICRDVLCGRFRATTELERVLRDIYECHQRFH